MFAHTRKTTGGQDCKSLIQPRNQYQREGGAFYETRGHRRQVAARRGQDKVRPSCCRLYKISVRNEERHRAPEHLVHECADETAILFFGHSEPTTDGVAGPHKDRPEHP